MEPRPKIEEISSSTHRPKIREIPSKNADSADGIIDEVYNLLSTDRSGTTSPNLRLQLELNKILARNFQITADELQTLHKKFEKATENKKVSSTKRKRSSGEANELGSFEFDQETLKDNNQKTLGQKIFESTDKFCQKIKDLRKRLEVKLKISGTNLSAGDTLEVQYLITMISVNMDLLSKFGDKSSQAFQTLFRNQ
ncbi:MAG: hypothetical protein K2L13_00015 [Opitutales bacterium]|nr:hypothetical protein [Opitutales bacterium]